MTQMQITFKSGAQVTVDVTGDLNTQKRDGALVKMEWESPGDWHAKLHTVCLSEIVAVVLLDDGTADDNDDA